MAFLGLDSPLKIGIFVAYISLIGSLGILIKLSQRGDQSGAYAYDITLLVFCTELLKMVLNLVMFLRTPEVSEKGLVAALQDEIGDGGLHTMGLYTIPALLYTLYNNFSFVGLRYFDPPTFAMLGQIRICIAALISRVVFSRELSGRQWIGIVLLTVGCAIKEADKLTSASALATAPVAGYCVLLFQVLAATSAGIANEKLLKGSRGHVNVQNNFMCVNSLMWNAFFVALGGNSSGSVRSFSAEAISAIVSNPFALMIMLNNALLGLAVGYFLKHLDMLLKAVASAMQIIITVVVSYYVFGTAFTAYSFASMCIISCGIWLYSVKPPPVGVALAAAAPDCEAKAANSAEAEPSAKSPVERQPLLVDHEEKPSMGKTQ